MAGAQFYLDHPGSQDEQNRPERSVRDLAGYFYDPAVGSVTDPETGEVLSACLASLRFDESESGELAFQKVRSAIEYQKRFPASKNLFCGISLNGGGVSHPGTIQGMPVNIVTEIKEIFSADIVTKPARGGKFLAMVNEAKRSLRRRRVMLGGPGRVKNAKALARQAKLQEVQWRAEKLRRSCEVLLHQSGISTRGKSRNRIFKEATALAKLLKHGKPALAFIGAYYGDKPPRAATNARKIFRETYRRGK